MTTFKYHDTDSGFCRINYTIKNAEGQRLIYCIQRASGNIQQTFGDDYELLRCSQEGEPSHLVTIKNGRSVKFELPIGDESIDREVAEWLNRHGLAA